MNEYVFPFEKISKPSRVAVYGAGDVGQQYVGQLLNSGIHDLVCVVDRDADRLLSAKVKIIKPEELCYVSFDYLVIAIKKKRIAEEICSKLEKYSLLGQENIIWVDPSRFSVKEPSVMRYSLPENNSAISAMVSIAICIGPGFGDAVCSKRLVVALAEKANYKCDVDLFVSNITYEFVKGLYRDCEFIRNVYSDDEYNYKRFYMQYDLAVKPQYISEIDHCDYMAIKNKNESFADVIFAIEEYLNKEGLRDGKAFYNAIFFRRCKMRGYNIYTGNSFGGILPIKDNSVNIPMDAEFRDSYDALHVKKPFITINYGWGDNGHGHNYVPSKIWPLEYYQELCGRIKEKYPNINIIQIGKKDNARIAYADNYFFDLNIEIVKFLLKDSLLHIDSEGGMVHLATQLGTKCMVFWGPTPLYFFGYESNINVISDKCSDCCYLDNDFTKCIRNMERPECMYSITPDMAYEKFEEYIQLITKQSLY